MVFLCVGPAVGGEAGEIPRLSENVASSAALEMRQVLHGQVDGLFAVPRARQVVAAAHGYLWKFSEQGVLQDTLHVRGSWTTSGVIFAPEHFVDWVFTGQAQHKPYGPAVDGNGLSHAEVAHALRRAELVEFGKTDASAWAYLWSNGRAWKMDLTSHSDKIDRYCHGRPYTAETLRWGATCFDTPPSTLAAWSQVDPDNSFADGSTQTQLEVLGFDRHRQYVEKGARGGGLGGTKVGLAPTAKGHSPSRTGRYWLGDAHTRLRVGNEMLQFKAFVAHDGEGYRFGDNMRWWEPLDGLSGSRPWLSVHKRAYFDGASEAALLPYYEKDIGLYVLRPKGSGEAFSGQGKEPTWRPLFEGPATPDAAVTGTVEFLTQQGTSTEKPVAAVPSAHVWLRSPGQALRADESQRPEQVGAVSPRFQQLPTAMTVAWGMPSQPQEYTVVRIEFDAKETQAVLARLWTVIPAMKVPDPTRVPRASNLDDPTQAAVEDDGFEVVVKMEDLKDPLNRSRVWLRTGRKQLPLFQARLSYVVQPVQPVAHSTPPQPPAAPVSEAVPSTASQWQKLQAKAAAARKDAQTGLPAFLQQAQGLARDPLRAETLAPHITEAYASLLNHYNKAGVFASSAKLIRHYLSEVHPRMASFENGIVGRSSLAYNQGVIASQTLAFAIHSPQYRNLVASVMTTLIGPGFDPQRQTNGTLMYNLACYYAVQGDKHHLLETASVARRLGKPVAQFMADSDFERYWSDAEFLEVLQATP